MILNLQKFLDTLQAKYPTAVDGGGFGSQVAPVAMCLLDLGGVIQVFDPITQTVRDISEADLPTLSVATVTALTVTTINKVTITQPASGSTLTIANGKTLTASNTITLTGTDGSTLNIGTGGTLGTAAFTATTAYATSAQGTLADNAQPASLALSNLAAVTPAGDNTYSNPTTITIQAGLITEIS